MEALQGKSDDLHLEVVISSTLHMALPMGDWFIQGYVGSFYSKLYGG